MHRKILVIFSMIFLLFSASLYAQEKKVLIINSYHKGFQWSDDVLSGMEEVLYQYPEITTNILYMDSKRINSEEYYEKLRELYKLQLKNHQYDLIIVVDKFAYDFLIKYYHELFTDEPILFTGIEQFVLEDVLQQELGDRVYGLLEKRAIGDTIPMISKMMPTLKKLTIINDASANGDDSEPFIQEAMQAQQGQFEIEYIRKSTLHELEQQFSTPQKDEAIFFIRFYNDKEGNLYKNSQIASMIAKSAVPVFITDTLFMGKGAFGGKLVPIQKLGFMTGEMAIDILNKQIKPLDVRVFDGYVYQFDMQKIQQFGLYPNPIIAHFELINAPLSFFEKYRALIDAVFLVSPFLVFLILGLIHNIYQRIKSQKELRAIELQKNKHQQFIIQQSKLAEIGEIFSSIAHQWKNPLVEIATIAQEHVYNCNQQGDEENSPYVNDIMIQVRYMTDTINDFQAFIMPSSDESIFDVREAIERMMKIISHTIKYNYIDVVIDTSRATNLMVSGYKNEFMQTLLNIVNNAKEQMKEAREAKRIKRGVISICIYNDAKNVIIEISDNGGGIPSFALPQIFNAYFTTKAQGHGIGLYMSKLIIEDKMHGKIKVSNTAQGACFTITLGNVQ